MIVVDASALIAILLAEHEATTFTERLRSVAQPRMSVASLLETFLVIEGRTKRDLRERIMQVVAGLNIVLDPVTLPQLWLAREGFRRFGKGKHRAGLNFGDCFAYALAKSLDLPLLFKGEDFRQTDIRPAV